MIKLPFSLCLYFCVFTILHAQNTGKTGEIYVRKIKTEELQNKNDIYYFNNKPFTGTSIDLFDNKTRMQEINWKNGLLHGTKTEYFLGGVAVRMRMNFYEGKRHGYFEYFHDNGKLMLNGKYHFDLLDSTVSSFYINGNPKYVHHYEQGKQVGESVSYFKNGNIENKINLKNEKPHGLALTYYEAGNIRQEGHYNQGIRDGQFLYYHLTGLIAEESYYKNGYQDSVSRFWDNVFGTMLKEQYYKMGKKDGVWCTFNENGDTLTMFTYKDDVLNGPYKKYYSGVKETGRFIYVYDTLVDDKGGRSYNQRAIAIKEYTRALNEVGSYKNGQLDGEYKSGLYLREAHVEGWYKEGMQVGEWKYYNENDKLVLHEKFNDDGELIYQKPKLKKVKN